MATDLRETATAVSVRASAARRQTHIHPVAAQVRSRFESSSYVELRSVESIYRAGHLTLTGLVPTFYLKQLATALAGGVEGVEQIDNRLDVSDFRSPLRPIPA
jgi:osmotically-inducible protein OsmY